jgi:hypothetical protein
MSGMGDALASGHIGWDSDRIHEERSARNSIIMTGGTA